jgi:hypothetical protein
MAAIIAIGTKPEKPLPPTLSLPLDALSVDGAEPEVGDEVEHSIKGKVTKISGDTATIRVTALDGSPVEGSPEEEKAESPEEEAGEEGSEGGGSSSGPGGSPRAGSPPGLPPELAALIAGRSKAKAATAALGKSLRRRARGQPIPMM